ncbi:MAG TPA: DUF2956 domain-containing protein [Gammaproteobacteria bacterium]|nr:DUF2956 domain-containing protein [Gammaproteobacteria bacterium]
MSKYSKKNNGQEKTQEEAVKIARGTQKPGQTREQTKLIAQGIQKGIELYKKEQGKKTRQANKKQKKAAQNKSSLDSSLNSAPDDGKNTGSVFTKSNRLPWYLLFLSWGLFVIYVALNSG